MWSVFLYLLVSLSLADELKATCIRVIDGDTVEIQETPTSVPAKVRLAQIDAPEKAQDYGVPSKVNLANLILYKDVIVHYTKKDRYGRILGQIYIDQTVDGQEQFFDVNLAQVEAGLAWVYTLSRYEDHYKDQETEARKAKRGLWKDPAPLAPWYYRKNLQSKKSD